MFQPASQVNTGDSIVDRARTVDNGGGTIPAGGGPHSRSSLNLDLRFARFGVNTFAVATQFIGGGICKALGLLAQVSTAGVVRGGTALPVGHIGSIAANKTHGIGVRDKGAADVARSLG